MGPRIQIDLGLMSAAGPCEISGKLTSVASTHGVSAAERHDLLVVEASRRRSAQFSIK